MSGDFRPPPPPDAGASFMGAHGLRNPVVAWLLRKHPELLALTPKAMVSRAVAPRCPDPQCQRPMVFRPGAYVCYYHWKRVEEDEVTGWVQVPIRVAHEVEVPRIVPVDDFGCPVDVLRRVNEPLDLVYDDGAWRVRKLDMP